jgi:mycofactocin precursor
MIGDNAVTDDEKITDDENAADVDELLVEEVSIDGMCGVY